MAPLLKVLRVLVGLFALGGAFLFGQKCYTGYQYQRAAHQQAIAAYQFLATPARDASGQLVKDGERILTHADVLAALATRAVSK